MSGTGRSAPTVLTPIAIDQPIGIDSEGRPVRATMNFAQMIQRILSALGQPIAGSSTGTTLFSQVDAAITLATFAAAAPGSSGVGLEARVATIEELQALLFNPRAAEELQAFFLPPPMPVEPAPFLVPPLVSELQAQADVAIILPATGDLLQYDGVDALWRNKPGSGHAQLSWLAAENPHQLVLFTAPSAIVVTGIAGRLEIAAGAAATITIVKAASGTALTAGTALHTGSFNANGTAATNQTLTLSATPADLALAAGDSIGILTTGLWTISTGGITVSYMAG